MGERVSISGFDRISSRWFGLPHYEDAHTFTDVVNSFLNMCRSGSFPPNPSSGYCCGQSRQKYIDIGGIQRCSEFRFFDPDHHNRMRIFHNGEQWAAVDGWPIALPACPVLTDVELLGETATLVGEIEVFEDIDFGGDRWRTPHSYSYVGDEWTDRISSIIVYAGTWQFFDHRDHQGNTWVWGPGKYGRVPFNDVISSWRQVG